MALQLVAINPLIILLKKLNFQILLKLDFSFKMTILTKPFTAVQMKKPEEVVEDVDEQLMQVYF